MFDGPTPNLSPLIRIVGSIALSVTYVFECRFNTKSLASAKLGVSSCESEPYPNVISVELPRRLLTNLLGTINGFIIVGAWTFVVVSELLIGM